MSNYKRTTIILVLLGAGLFLFQVASYGWGFLAHKMINRKAVEALPDAMQPFFGKYQEYLAEHAIDPDLWRHGDSNEGVRHYIDIDMYGPYPFTELPRQYDAAIQKFSADTVNSLGIAPWWIEKQFNRLVRLMKQGASDSLLIVAAAIGHYVSDLHMPLHTVENYDGQLTGNKGIHARFEAWMIEEYAHDIHLTVKPAEYIDDPLAFIFGVVMNSYQLADHLLQADNQSKTPGKVYGRREDYDKEYIASLYKESGAIAQSQMSQAAWAVASMWYSAWVKAGKPELKVTETLDPLLIAPKNYRVEFENEYLRVIREKYDPHEKTVMHEHSAGPILIVPLTDGHLRFTLPDGQIIESRLRAGETQWFSDEKRMPKHAVENLSDQPNEQLRIEIKARPVSQATK